MKKDYFISFLHRLPNHDFITTYFDIVMAISNTSGDIDNEHFVKALAKVKEHLPLLDLIVAKERGHVLTKSIDHLNSQRINMTRGIISLLKGYMREVDPKIKEAAELVYRWFKLNSHVLPIASQNAISRAIEELFKQRDDNEDFGKAITTMGLDSSFDSLNSINNSYRAVRAQRTIVWGGERVPKIVTSKIRNEAMDGLTMLMQTIESLSKWNIVDMSRLDESLRLELERAKVVLQRIETLRKIKRNAQPAGGGSALPMPVAERTHSDIDSSNDFKDKPADIDANGASSESSEQAI